MKKLVANRSGRSEVAGVPVTPDLFGVARGAQWLDENREAIDAYNQRVEREGVFSDGLRSF